MPILPNYLISLQVMLEFVSSVLLLCFICAFLTWFVSPLLALSIQRRCMLRIGECPRNSPLLKNNGAEAHCF